ncbi:Amino-acid acetyltransferase, mitochondrial [Coemansia interrupta]|uniref:Amino-acid acetyltransferase, mitochondrial n=1 Tax=Coemansia interrupta TaxID=1126814 RepID=A0A9W8HD13_9FUNG|nr:Amino-acid acetyltransferase, mitochondrial [Coemansia interrupta]
MQSIANTLGTHRQRLAASAGRYLTRQRSALYSNSSSSSSALTPTAAAKATTVTHYHDSPPSSVVSAASAGQPRNQRERELILSVLSTVPSPREARKFLNSVSGSETMRSQREFEEHQARLASAEQSHGHVPLPGEMLWQSSASRQQHQLGARRRDAASAGDPVPRRLTAAVFVDAAAQDELAWGRTGKLLAQIQRLGVSPVVLLLAAATEGTQGDGYRHVIRGVHRLADAVEREGGRARPINEGVFYTNPYGASQVAVDPELVGSAIAQGQIPIVSPLVASAALQVQVLGADKAAPALAQALALSTSTRRPMAGSQGAFSLLLARLIMLGSTDGISATDGTFHRFVNLQEDYGEILQGCRHKETLGLMRTCLGILPPTAAGIVASVHSDPSLVMKGLISERPVGTQHQSAAQRVRKQEEEAERRHARLGRQGVPDYRPLASYPFARVGRDDAVLASEPGGSPQSTEPPTQFTLLRHGFSIQRHTTLDTCDLPRLRALLESSFKRTLAGGPYFDRLRRLSSAGGIEIIVAGDYQGAVIVTYEPLGAGASLPYLDKFAVLPSVQGTGMADILWAQLRRACPRCMWRSRNDNGVNRWYFDRSSGHSRAPPRGPGEGTRWVFFWYQGDTASGQVFGADDVQRGIEVAGGIPPSFV